MPLDMATLSDAELTALASGKMSDLSDATLAKLAKPDVPAGPRVPKWGVDNPTLYGIAGAARDYGVVAAGDPPVVDIPATETLRAHLRQTRAPLPDVAWQAAE